MPAQSVLFDRFEPLDVIAPFEELGAARALTDRVTVELAGAEADRRAERLFAHERRGAVRRDQGPVPVPPAVGPAGAEQPR